MMTFLPYPDFKKSAQCLDNKRLGKQRVEVLQIYNALQPNSTSGWKNHPAVKMWKEGEDILLLYGIEICEEWRKRGFKDTLLDKFQLELSKCNCSGNRLNKPKWLGNEEFHASHRSNLLRKDPIWYGKFGWKEKSNLPYIWGDK